MHIGFEVFTLEIKQKWNEEQNLQIHQIACLHKAS